MDENLPLTGAQSAIGDVLSPFPDRSVSNLAGYCEVKRAVDVGRFREAAGRVCAASRAFLGSDPSWTLPFQDLSSDPDPASAALGLMNLDASRAWDPSHDPLATALLFQLASDRFFFYLRAHEQVTDLPGVRDLARRALAAYDEGVPQGRLEEAIPEGKDEGHPGDEAYWRQLLENRSEAVTLSGKLPTAAACRPAVSHSQALGQATSRGLLEFSRIQGRSLKDTILGLVALYLHRFTGETDLVVGTPVWPLRFRVDPRQEVRGLWEAAVRQGEQARLHRRVLPGTLGVPGLVVEVVDQDPLWTTLAVGPVLDLFLMVRSDPLSGELWLDLWGNSAFYSVRALELHGQRFSDLLASDLATLSATLISGVSLLGEGERQTVLRDWNGTVREFDRTRCVHELFEAQAEKSPGAVAVAFQGKSLTYAQLNGQANQLARYLRTFGVGPGILAAICMERGIDMILGLLAILKAGGAYVPLDPHFPSDRLDYMLADSAPAVLLGEPATEPHLAQLTGKTPRVNLGDPAAPWSKLSSANLPRSETGASPEHLSYVIYTSGSTGQPKGVGISGLNLLNYALFIVDKLPQAPHLKFASVSTIAADLGNTVVFPSLIGGGELHIISSDAATNAVQYERYMAEHRIDVLKITPSHFKALFEANQSAVVIPRAAIVFGGERLTSDLVDSIVRMRPECLVYNHYGPTECTVGSIMHLVERNRDPGVSIPLGYPIANSRIYVLDEAGQPVPVGVTGEIFIAGAGVAGGYLNRPEETAKRFLRDPFSPNPTDRMYKTGDLGRWLSNGMIEFLGRNDFQVKLRGFRIELGEIEAALAQHPAIRETAIVVKEDSVGKRLVAFYASKEPVRDELLKTHLLATLPEYMVPTLFLRLESMPLTPNGKVDRRQLESLVKDRQVACVDDEVTSADCSVLLTHLKTILMVPEVDLQLSFVDHGGDSLSYIRATMIVEKTLGWLPEDWEKMPLGSLDAQALKDKPSVFRSVTTTILGRALGILNVLCGHFGIFSFLGSTTALFILAGISIGKYQLNSVLKSNKTASLWKTILSIAIPTTLFSVFLMLKETGTISLPVLFMVNTYFSTAPAAGYWFIDVLVHIYLILAIVLAIPQVRERLRGRVFEYAYGAAIVCLAFSAVEFLIQDRHPIRTPMQEIWLIFLGIAMAFADTNRKKALVAFLILFSGFDELYGQLYSGFPVVVCLFVLFVPRLKLPSFVAWTVNTIAGASLYIYISHLSFKGLVDRTPLAGNSWVYLVVGLVGGVLVWKVWERVFNPAYAAVTKRLGRGRDPEGSMVREEEV